MKLTADWQFVFRCRHCGTGETARTEEPAARTLEADRARLDEVLARVRRERQLPATAWQCLWAEVWRAARDGRIVDWHCWQETELEAA